jgi:hypothetical protein
MTGAAPSPIFRQELRQSGVSSNRLSRAQTKNPARETDSRRPRRHGRVQFKIFVGLIGRPIIL